jgi:iron-sulfur cluster assembly protein
MFTITSEAAVAIKSLLAATDMSDDAGLRLTPAPAEGNGTAPQLQAVVAVAPDPDDTVIEENGAQVFLDGVAAEALHDKSLHAEVQGGNVMFAIVDEDGREVY